MAAELTAVEVNDFIQQLQEDYSPKLVREVGGLLLRIVAIAGVGYGDDVELPKAKQKAVEVFTESELRQDHPAMSRQNGPWCIADSLHRVAAGRAVRPAMAGRGRRRGTAAHPADGGAHRADGRRDAADGAAAENGDLRTLDTHSKRDAADAEAGDKAAGQLPADRRGDRP